MKPVCAKNNGFAVLLVLAITSSVLLLSLAAWKKSSMLFDIAVQRETFYQNLYEAEMMLHEGLDVVCKDFDRITKSFDTITQTSITPIISRTPRTPRIQNSVQKPVQIILQAVVRQGGPVCNIPACNIIEAKLFVTKNMRAPGLMLRLALIRQKQTVIQLGLILHKQMGKINKNKIQDKKRENFTYVVSHFTLIPTV